MSAFCKLSKDIRFYTLIALIILSVLIWLAAPALTFANHASLTSLETRLTIILLLALVWGISNLLLTFKMAKHKANIAMQLPAQIDNELANAQAKVRVLQQSISDAIRFLNKKFHQRWFNRYRIPWYLVIGPQNVGKTSLLARSGLPFITVNNDSLENISHTQYCDWWFTNKAIFIDVAGKLIVPEQEKQETNLIWLSFIRLIRHYRRRPVDGVIITLDVNYLQHDKQTQQLQLDSICHHIQNLTQYIANFPVYLIFTKCDQITGFHDFFANLSAEEYQQACGITISANVAQQNFSQLINKQYDELLKRLNLQLIWRLHQEHNINKRTHIKAFPLQMESLKPAIINLVGQLHSTNTSLCGIYFTSSAQDGKIADYLMKPLSQALELIPRTLANAYAKPQQKSYFVNTIFHEIIAISPKRIYNKVYRWPRNTFYTISGLLIALSYLSWQSYNTDTNLINSLKTNITNYLQTTNTSNSQYAFLSTLDVLEQSVYNLNSHDIFLIGFRQINSLRDSINRNYQQALSAQLIPRLQQSLEAQLLTVDTDNPKKIFDALKVYLMLGNPQYLNANFVENWFKNYWQQTLPNDIQTQQALMHHLTALFNSSSIKITLNMPLITTVRQTLSAFSLPQLVYAELEDQYNSADNTAILTSPTLFKFTKTIAKIYLAVNFNDIYYTIIPKICQSLDKGNWVLGNNNSSNLSANAAADLINNVRALYIKQYVSAWQDQLANIQWVNAQSLPELNANLKKISGANSALLETVKAAELNLQPITADPSLAQPVKDNLQAINNLSVYAKDYVTQKAISNLSDYINEIASDKDTNRAALRAAQLRMQTGGSDDAIGNLLTQAQRLPAPLNQWLNEIAANSWQLVLQNAADGINKTWVAKILPQYQQTINNRYPIFKNAKTDISLTDFSNFFSATGAMNNFFNNYLSPFVDTSQLYWEWKKVDGQALNIPQSSLEVFIRAALIRKMYFPDNNNVMDVGFSLVPAVVDMNTKSFTVDIDGKKINFLQSFSQNNLQWPGLNPNYASLQYINNQGQQLNLSTSGPWALFKLLDQAHIQATPNAKLYKLEFNINNNPVSFELIANSVINPFLSDIITSFRCPDSL